MGFRFPMHSLHLAQGVGISDDPMPEVRWVWYRGTSLIRNTPLLGPTVGLYLGSYGGPRGGGLFHMSEVPL